MKINLFFEARTASLRYKYRKIFLDEEKKFWHTMKPVEKIMFFCARRKILLPITQIIRKLLILKAKIYIK
jgi:hypothetical protein